MSGHAGRLHAVQRIALLRPNALGDFVFALPALAALRAAYPGARISWLGRRWHREFLSGRPGLVDEAIELPAVPGVGAEPDAPHEPAAIERFVERLQQRRFDLVLQMYGGGRYSNPFARRLGGRCTVGLRASDAPALDRELAYDCWRNERLRLLELVSLVGAPAVDLDPRLAPLPSDEAALAAAGPLPMRPFVVLQPGASDPRRRWPAERFAQLGDALAAEGAAVLVNGCAEEAPLTRQVVGTMHFPATDLAGLPLPGLLALLARARLVVSNDTGPLHLAMATGTPTIGLYWSLNLLSAAPLVEGPHRSLLSIPMDCPVCGVPNVHVRCEHDPSFLHDLSADQVGAVAVQRWRELDAAAAALSRSARRA